MEIEKDIGDEEREEMRASIRSVILVNTNGAMVEYPIGLIRKIFSELLFLIATIN